MATSTGTRTYGVKLVRGAVVEVAPHPDAPASREELLTRDYTGQVTSADLFCGCGGISLGLEASGVTSLVGVDHDSAALQTWAGLFPGLPIEADLHDPKVIVNLIKLLKDLEVDIIAGGPPCQPFSRAGLSKIRDLVAGGQRDAHDRRRDLWQAFVDIVVGVNPPAVIMENVPDLALADDMLILRTIVDDLEKAGYGVHTRILSAQDHGVPQLRQRLILVALRDGGSFLWPEADERRLVTLADAIADLPEVEGGWLRDGDANGWTEYRPEDSPFVESMRDGLPEAHANRIYDHVTRPVRDDDREIFEQMDSSTKYTDISPELQRYRDDIFTDKYKRLALNQPSRSITAHIAKDGYWYIHPTQHRTITIREAARIQTFPDRVRFAGPPSVSFRQIGNAVPPKLAEQVGRQVVGALEEPKGRVMSTRTSSAALAAWFEQRADDGQLSAPWLRAAKTPWQVIAAELLLGRDDRKTANVGWNAVVKKMGDPEATIENATRVRQLASYRGKPERAETLLAAAAFFAESEDPEPQTWEELAAAPGVGAPTAKLAETAAASETAGHILPLQAPLRVAARFNGTAVDRVNKSSDGRLAIARLVGGSVYTNGKESRSAVLALMELGQSICRVSNPVCVECPLADLGCVERRSDEASLDFG